MLMSKVRYKKYISVDKLISTIKKYRPSFNEKKFLKAFKFGHKAHEFQLRKDKKTPYFVHPLKVVEILASLHADEDILIAALLHDVPEDTKYDIAEVRSLFGEKVAFLVDGITKLSKVHYQHDMPQRQIESLKKLFIHSAKDPRVILIKLADRLHNMRTLQFVDDPTKRLRIARETLEIYVPMANLLGIQELKAELEDHCFKYIFPEDYKKLSKYMEKFKKKNEKAQKDFISKISKGINEIKLKAAVSERRQSLYTIYKKLQKQGKTIDDVEERNAFRIVTKTIPECYEALGIVHGMFVPKIKKFKDYIANPKPNQYQSLHTTVFGVNGVLTDVQIRTRQMDLNARFGICANFFNKGKILEDQRSSFVKDILEIDKSSNGSQSFMEGLKEDILKERITVFSPKGGKFDLPSGASAIDFAYSIHSQVGNHAIKADINGQLMPITTPLVIGDTIRIITDPGASPSSSWLSFAKTGLARKRIHDFLKKTSKKRKIAEGNKILQKEFDIAGLGLIESYNIKKFKSKIFESFDKKMKSYDDLFVAVGEGDIKAFDVANLFKKKKKLKRRSIKGGIKVNIKINAVNSLGLIRKILRPIYKYALDMHYFKAWSSNKNEDAYFNASVVVRDLADVGYIFDELEQIDEVKFVCRVPSNILYLSYFLIFFTGLTWLLHPLIFRYLLKFDFIQNNPVFTFLVNFGLFCLFVVVLFLTNVAKNYLPYIRNKKRLWLLAFGVPAIAIASLVIDIVYFKFKLSWWAVFIELILIYALLTWSLFSLKKKYKKARLKT